MSPYVTPENPEKQTHFQPSAARGAAVDARNPPIDFDLTEVIERWPALPDAVRTGILAMVRATE